MFITSYTEETVTSSCPDLSLTVISRSLKPVVTGNSEVDFSLGHRHSISTRFNPSCVVARSLGPAGDRENKNNMKETLSNSSSYRYISLEHVYGPLFE